MGRVARVTHLSDRLSVWMAPHPLWTPNPEWPEEVGCVLYAGSDATVLIDPLIRADVDAGVWDWLDRSVAQASRPVAVLLTAPWHERSTGEVVERYDGAVWVHPSARDRFSDFAQVGSLPNGIETFAPRGVEEGQVAFHIEPERTLVVGDFLLGTGAGLAVCPSPSTTDMPEFARSLGDLERLAVERVLVGHGPPVLRDGDDAIRAALDAFVR